MTPEEVRQIIREEFSNIFKIDRYVFDRKIQILDGRNIQLGRGNGTIIATQGYGDLTPTDVGQKLGFFGTPPVVQRTGSAQTAVATTGATQTNPYGYSTAAQADGIITLLNELRQALVNLGLIYGS